VGLAKAKILRIFPGGENPRPRLRIGGRTNSLVYFLWSETRISRRVVSGIQVGALTRTRTREYLKLINKGQNGTGSGPGVLERSVRKSSGGPNFVNSQFQEANQITGKSDRGGSGNANYAQTNQAYLGGSITPNEEGGAVLSSREYSETGEWRPVPMKFPKEKEGVTLSGREYLRKIDALREGGSGVTFPSREEKAVRRVYIRWVDGTMKCGLLRMTSDGSDARYCLDMPTGVARSSPLRDAPFSSQKKLDQRIPAPSEAAARGGPMPLGRGGVEEKSSHQLISRKRRDWGRPDKMEGGNSQIAVIAWETSRGGRRSSTACNQVNLIEE